ncbi:MAG TPA: PspC domain-containing protein, partial [Streptosporangiaceae bacterium]|nr:PspC domain-containing protein [Streptosporangiaceae bacterium]
MEERSGPAPPGLADGQGEPWRPPWPDHDGAAPENGWPRRRRPWRHWRHHQWVGRPHGSGPLRRAREDRLVAGVAAGLAARTGVDVTVVRVVFVVLALLGGFGVAAYVVAWLLLPAEGADGSIASRALNDRRGLALAAGLGSLLAIMLLIAPVLGARWLNSVGLALVVSAIGITLIWRNSPAEEHAVLRRLAEPVLGLAQGGRRSRSLLRIGGSVLLLVIGLGALLSGRSAHQLAGPLAGLLTVIIAIVVMLGPWWLRIARDLVLERQARARAEERADMAAHLHDSVLQTLALIQRRADQPQQVIQLARAQERELRTWLFDGMRPGSANGQGTTLAGGVR